MPEIVHPFRSRLTVVVPIYNEAEVLPDFHRRLMAVLKTLPIKGEVLYVDDGSTDTTRALLDQIQSRHRNNTSVLSLSRNFGKEMALSAGLDHTDGDAVVIMDVDLQDPPELISDMVLAWSHGYDVVCMKRTCRKSDSFLKRTTARMFYRLMGKIGDVEILADVGDFRLLSRRAVNALRQFPERTRFMKGLFAWIGLSQKVLCYQRRARHRGKTKFRFWQLFNLALEGITSFSVAPLRLASYLGCAVSFFAFAYGMFIVIKALLFGDPVTGFPTLMATLTFLGGAQLLAIGILGEYLGRVFIETKQRPLYLVDSFKPAHRANAAATSSTEYNTRNIDKTTPAKTAAELIQSK